VLLRCFCNGVHVCVCLVSLYYCLFSPLGHHRYVRSFPTRRSSDLHLLFDEKAVFTELNRKINTTFEIKVIPIEMDKQYTKDMLDEEATPLFVKRKNGTIEFITQMTRLALAKGDQLAVLAEKKHEF